jgi:hypothetical protein
MLTLLHLSIDQPTFSQFIMLTLLHLSIDQPTLSQPIMLTLLQLSIDPLVTFIPLVTTVPMHKITVDQMLSSVVEAAVVLSAASS